MRLSGGIYRIAAYQMVTDDHVRKKVTGRAAMGVSVGPDYVYQLNSAVSIMGTRTRVVTLQDLISTRYSLIFQ